MKTRDDMRKKKQLEIDGNRLTLEDFEDVVFNGTPVVLSAGARRNMLESRQVVERIAAFRYTRLRN